ncbi:MAG TPA: hypothetical protein VLW26_01870 [Steroidobacteraceae bacterium]|nr:hypothetical protein [Steroidobacteraceae bacterium]
MKRVHLIPLVFLACIPAAALAASPFDGTWKLRANDVKFPQKPSVYVLDHGQYECKSCVPSIKVAADGTDQKVTGHSTYDSITVRVVNATTVETTSKLGGRLLDTSTMTVSADGSTMTTKDVDVSGAQPATYVTKAKRVAPAPAGSHAISGSWQTTSLESASDSGSLVTYQGTDNGLKMSANGVSYDAKFGGPSVPITNDPTHTMAALKRINANTIQETDSRGGKPVDIATMTVSADGKSLAVKDNNVESGRSFEYVLVKQP